MRKTLVLFIPIVLATWNFYGQVAVNSDGSSPDASAILDVQSTQMGFLPPRLSEVENCLISNPAEGLIIYNTSRNAV